MRVIQDSDDESGSEVEDHRFKDAPTAPRVHVKGASSGATGSTESLKRAFAKAHHDHLQSPSAQDATPSAKEPQSSVSLPEHPSKRRKTSNNPDGDIVLSPRHFTKHVPHGTSGSARVDYPSTDLVQHQITDQALSHGTEVVNFMDLPDTVRQEYAQHDPMALFPEPSSTVPNATQTQQRLLEGIAGPTLLGSDSNIVALQPQYPIQGSVPWSDILDFSPAGAGEQSDYANQRSEPVSETVHPGQATGRTQDTSISQPVRRGSSVRLRDSPLRHEVLSEHFDPKEPTPSLCPVLPSHAGQICSTGSDQSKQNTQNPSSGTPKKLKPNVNATQNSDDELMDVGLPTEQYNPRPSRSRSLKVSTDELVDYSIRPEKALKGAKRRKPTSSAATTRSASVNDSVSTPQKIKQICEMGFTPTSTGKALKQNHGDVTQTIEWLVSNGMAEDELARPNTPNRRPLPKSTAVDCANAADESLATKMATGENTSATGKSLAAADAVPEPGPNPPESPELVRGRLKQSTVSHSNQNKSPKVQVVISSKSPRTKSVQETTLPQDIAASNKPKRRKTTSDLPEPDSVCEPPTVVAPTTEKKKRGRPKKVPNTHLAAEAIQEEGKEKITPLKLPTGEDDASINIRQTIEAKTEHATTLVESGNHTMEDTSKTPSVAAKEPTAQRPSTTSHTPEQATKTPSRSPTGKSKATYRVGLSKRARIAPLLRTLKK